MTDNNSIAAALDKRFFAPLRRKRTRRVGVELELPVCNRTPGKATDFAAVHVATDEFLGRFDFPDISRDDEWNALLRFGGFPDPFRIRDVRFSRRWNALRFEQLTKTDMRDLTRIGELDQLAALAEILSGRSGEQLVYKSLGCDLGIDEKTVKKWIKTLKHLYFGFEVRPWFKNVENSIRKMPKWYMRDWANVKDDGKRAETLVACHLLKAVEGWTDLGYGDFALGYLRDKSRREVDFIVTRDGNPWFLVEVKKGDETLSDALGFFQRRLCAKHAFQVVLEAGYVDSDCFECESPVVVPARAFLSHLF